MAKLDRVKWDSSAGVAENARLRLPPLVEAYFKGGRQLLDRKWSPAALHRFRLNTKRLRYTLELFRSCYGPGLERYLAALRQLQDYLGAINDCTTTKELVSGALPRRSPYRSRIDSLLAARARRTGAQLRQYWREGFDRPGEERRWMSYLSRSASRPKSARPRSPRPPGRNSG